MNFHSPQTPEELLAIILCPARIFGDEADAEEVMKAVREEMIRRWQASRRS